MDATTTSQKREAVPRRARISGSQTCVSLNSRLESTKEEEEVMHLLYRPMFSVHGLESGREQLERVKRLLPASRGQTLALTVLYVPTMCYSRDSGPVFSRTLFESIPVRKSDAPKRTLSKRENSKK